CTLDLCGMHGGVVELCEWLSFPCRLGSTAVEIRRHRARYRRQTTSQGFGVVGWDLPSRARGGSQLVQVRAATSTRRFADLLRKEAGGGIVGPFWEGVNELESGATSLLRRGGVARSAGVVLIERLIFLNEPPWRFAPPRLNQAGEFALSNSFT